MLGVSRAAPKRMIVLLRLSVPSEHLLFVLLYFSVITVDIRFFGNIFDGIVEACLSTMKKKSGRTSLQGKSPCQASTSIRLGSRLVIAHASKPGEHEFVP